jgi:hypothetical protein
LGSSKYGARLLRTRGPRGGGGGLPDTRFHDLRHTCATLLLTKGVHPKVVSQMLGHSSIAITLDTYLHVIPGLGEVAPASWRMRCHSVLRPIHRPAIRYVFLISEQTLNSVMAYNGMKYCVL